MAWAGVVAPVLFVATFAIEGALRPGYSAITTYVSALSLGPRGWVQIANFIVSGLLLLAFALRTRASSRAGAILLGVVAVGLVASGIFVMDPMGTPRNAMTLHGRVHEILGAIVFTAMPITCVVLSKAGHARFRAWSLFACAVIVVAIILMKVGQLGTAELAVRVGLSQRIALVTFFSWLFAFASRSSRSAIEEDRRAPG
jgi:hypothetical membrane protein